MAQTEPYPTRPIQFIVPGAVGGGTYTIARMFADKLGESLGQPVVVVTLPGASGTIGVQKVTSSKPDGYTVLFGYNQLTAMSPHLQPNLPYNVERDLQPVSLLAESAFVWIARTGFSPSSVRDWASFAKSRPGKVTFGHNGSATAASLGAELFMQHTGSEMLGVPYKADASTDLQAGLIDLKMDPLAQALPLLKSGRVKALAVTSPARVSLLPDVPTMAETVPGYAITASYSAWAPAGTPRAVIDRLHRELVKIATQPAFAERLAAFAVTPVGSTPDELQAANDRESKMWAALIKARNIKVDRP
ncbi:MAG TPA: tripartite tricarboxylate transporter substrate binding protein [Burkholderiaceae bacterium]|nr:tripartite tricarboxylate transporter substrate binding protein [Burkholderiaceae bacterium]